MTKVNNKHVGWGFWLWWVLASTVGAAVGLRGIAVEVVDGVMGGAVVGAVGGSVVGILQWLVMRQHLTRAGWWVLANTVGFAVYDVIAVSVMPYGVPLRYVAQLHVFEAVYIVTGVAAGGAVVGILQWLVLRQHLTRAGWWVLASTVGLAVGFIVVDVTDLAFTVSKALGNEMGAAIIGVIVSFATRGAVGGAITGSALVWLLRQPKLEE